MTTFNPGDKVIKRNETNPKNCGEVMDIPPTQMMIDENDLALQLLRDQLAALDKYPPPPGQVPGMQKTHAELREELRQQILDEMARYSEWKAKGFPPALK